jgi:N6-adenosine-specific RNA methylase IME4
MKKVINPSRDIILIDPPWEHKVWSKKGAGRTASSHYQCMSNEELRDLEKPLHYAFPDDSVMFMWTTGPQMMHAIDLMNYWGWIYKTVAFVWTKLVPSYLSRFDTIAHTHLNMPFQEEDFQKSLDYQMHMGMGYYTRANPEYVILGTRGTSPFQRMRKNIRCQQFAVVSRHSEKPHKINKEIELLARRPLDECYELFARRQYSDWHCTGLELDGKDIRIALEEIGNNKRIKDL